MIQVRSNKSVFLPAHAVRKKNIYLNSNELAHIYGAQKVSFFPETMQKNRTISLYNVKMESEDCTNEWSYIKVKL